MRQQPLQHGIYARHAGEFKRYHGFYQPIDIAWIWNQHRQSAINDPSNAIPSKLKDVGERHRRYQNFIATGIPSDAQLRHTNTGKNVAMAQHRALSRPSGTASILQHR